jgi:hypothetical protein
VPAALSAQATKVNENLFVVLSDQGERGNESVKSIFVATDSADAAADLLAADEDRVGEWFSSYDELTVDLGEDVLAKAAVSRLGIHVTNDLERVPIGPLLAIT